MEDVNDSDSIMKNDMREAVKEELKEEDSSVSPNIQIKIVQHSQKETPEDEENVGFDLQESPLPLPNKSAAKNGKEDEQLSVTDV